MKLGQFIAKFARTHGYMDGTHFHSSHAAAGANKLAVTDHVKRLNRVVYWEGTQSFDRESNKRKRHMREYMWIRRVGSHAMNRDEGNYDLPMSYNTVIPAESQC